MVITLLSQSALVILLLLCPWEGLANFMEVKAMDYSNVEQSMFRVYLLIVPCIHLILAIGIEVILLIV